MSGGAAQTAFADIFRIIASPRPKPVPSLSPGSCSRAPRPAARQGATALNIPHPLPRRYLAAMAAAAFARTAAADPPLIADGAPLDIAPGTYETTEASEYGLIAINGGRAEGRDVHILTSGKDSYAVRVADPGSSVTLTGGSLRSTGVGAHGLVVRATQGTAATLDGVTIVTEGAGASGASFEQDGAHGQFLGGSIETGGYAAIGIHARDG